METFDGVAGAQRGLLLTRQCIELFGRCGFERRVAAGDLIKAHHGLYRTAGTVVTCELTIVAANLLYDAVGSIGAAAAAHGFNGFPVLRPEVTVLDSFGIRNLRLLQRCVVMHRTNFLPAEHRMVVDGMSITTPARTVCDLSRRFGAKALTRLVDDAVRRDKLTYSELAECRDDLRARGRRRTTVLDAMLEARGYGFHPGESAPELNVRTCLEDAGLPPEVQVEVFVAGKKRRLDLAYVAERVAVEYYGIDAHKGEIAVIDDSQRTTELQLAGWLVVIVTKATTKPELIAMVRDALEQRRK